MLRNWFEGGLRFHKFLLLLPVLVLFCMGLAYGGRELVEFAAPSVELSGRTTSYRVVLQSKGILEMAPRSFAWVPFKEEALYRLAPFLALWGGWAYLFASKPPIGVAFALVGGTSAYFGYAHGGVGNMLIQGVVGVILALTYLKVSGYGSAPFKGFAATMLLHGAYNFSIALNVQYHLSYS